MDGIFDENIHPCKGCEDYIPPNGCQSNGGCGGERGMTRAEAIFVLEHIEAHGSLAIKAKEMAIEALKQEPKTGHWIIHGEPPINVIECSECGQKYHNHYCQPLARLCSMCGAKMEKQA